MHNPPPFGILFRSLGITLQAYCCTKQDYIRVKIWYRVRVQKIKCSFQDILH